MTLTPPRGLLPPRPGTSWGRYDLICRNVGSVLEFGAELGPVADGQADWRGAAALGGACERNGGN